MAASSQSHDAFWLFGYGSLVWRPDLHFDESREGYISGFVRRFWQSSPDHRGTPKSPGRVCTLVPILPSAKIQPTPSTAERLWGLQTSHLYPGEAPIVHGSAYHIPAEHAQAELAKLLHREIAGYEMVNVKVQCADGQTLRALVFTATPENEHWAGPPADTLAGHEDTTGSESTAPGHPRSADADRVDAPWGLTAIASIIARSHGPSGPNSEYLSRLVAALAARGQSDAYLALLQAAVAAAVTEAA